MDTATAEFENGSSDVSASELAAGIDASRRTHACYASSLVDMAMQPDKWSMKLDETTHGGAAYRNKLWLSETQVVHHLVARLNLVHLRSKV